MQRLQPEQFLAGEEVTAVGNRDMDTVDEVVGAEHVAATGGTRQQHEAQEDGPNAVFLGHDEEVKVVVVDRIAPARAARKRDHAHQRQHRHQAQHLHMRSDQALSSVGAVAAQRGEPFATSERVERAVPAQSRAEECVIGVAGEPRLDLVAAGAFEQQLAPDFFGAQRKIKEVGVGDSADDGAAQTVVSRIHAEPLRRAVMPLLEPEAWRHLVHGATAATKPERGHGRRRVDWNRDCGYRVDRLHGGQRRARWRTR